MLGLKKGQVLMCEHRAEWEIEANAIIRELKHVLSDCAIDIQHIGSTSIKNIKAKPIIDIAIGVLSIANLDYFLEPLSDIGVYKSSGQPFENIVLFSKDDISGNRCVNIQVVIYGEEQWNKHILFRDYLNFHSDKAIEYEKIKVEAAELFPNDVLSYSNYKSVFIQACILDAKKERISNS